GVLRSHPLGPVDQKILIWAHLVVFAVGDPRYLADRIRGQDSLVCDLDRDRILNQARQAVVANDFLVLVIPGLSEVAAQTGSNATGVSPVRIGAQDGAAFAQDELRRVPPDRPSR